MTESNSDRKTSESVGKRISLARMKVGQKGDIVRIRGGHGIVNRLRAFGIREGQEIKKISNQWIHGPVLLQHGSTQLALGFGLASRVLVKITG